MEINQGTLRTLHTGFSAIFNGALQDAMAKSTWADIAQKVPSDTKRSEFAWLRNIPQLKLDLGPAEIESLVRQSYTILNHRYKTFAELDVDDIEDDNLGTYRNVFEMHARESADWIGNAVFTMLPKGITSAGKSFDGENFFSASHTRLDGSTYSNYDNDGGSSDPLWYLLCTTRGIKPILFQERKPVALTLKNQLSDDNVFFDDKVVWGIKARLGFGYSYPQLAYASRKDLDATNLEAAVEAMMGFTRDDGTKMNIMPDTIVVGPSNYYAAKKLVMNELDSSGGTNVHKGSFKVVQSQYVESVSLTLADAGG